jgi:hypothetical protein
MTLDDSQQSACGPLARRSSNNLELLLVGRLEGEDRNPRFCLRC